MVQKIYSKMDTDSCTNTHHDITDLVNHGMVKSTKSWIPWEQNRTFLWNKILNLCLRWHILRSYRSVVGVNFKHLINYKTKNLQVISDLLPNFHSVVRHFQLSEKSTRLLNEALELMKMRPIHDVILSYGC